MEVKGDYLRRANLLMHPQDAAGHHPAAPAQVGHASHATMQGWDGWWDSVGHAPGQHSVGHAQVGSHLGDPAQVGSWKLSKKRRLGGRIKKSGVAKRAKVHRKFPMRLAAVGHAVGSGHCPDGQPRCDQPVGQDAVGHTTGQVECLFF